MDFRIFKVKQHVLKSLDDLETPSRFSLKELSRIANLSYAYFSTLFKKQAGISLIKFIKQKKMEKAELFLKNSDAQVKEISYLLGYRSIWNFFHDFRKTTGMTPTRCRQKNQQSNQ
ncbi:MAG: AraC family transcriptional regulator [Acidobacteriota bacterium]|nr:AraC family transcriptional regulator [Acidobacteriota bacterium]